MYYSTIITSVMMPRDDPGEINHPCLRVGCHSWYQSITDVIHRVRTYLRKHMMRKRLDVHIRTIVILISGKLTAIYFMYLLYAFYYSITMHL
jgi:hypothetical protein